MLLLIKGARFFVANKEKYIPSPGFMNRAKRLFTESSKTDFVFPKVTNITATMSDEINQQYIYCVVNDDMTWFELDGVPNKSGSRMGIPYPLCKVGRTDSLRNRLGQANPTKDNTWMPGVYKFAFAMRVNNDVKAETRVHNILKGEGLWRRPDGKGNGTEWFYATLERIHTIFSTIIHDEFEGEFVDPPQPKLKSMTNEEILKVVEKEDLRTSDKYINAPEELGLPPEPWGQESAYYYLNPDMRGHSQLTPMGVFLDKLGRENVKTPSSYESMLAYHPECRLFPSLDNITDGYFEGFKSFTELIDRYFPQRSRR
jgi:hypothetical protein